MTQALSTEKYKRYINILLFIIIKMSSIFFSGEGGGSGKS